MGKLDEFLTPLLLILLALGLVLILPYPVEAEPRDEIRAALGGVRDYTSIWWMHGLRDERKVFAIQTSRYAMAFDVPGLRLTHLGLLEYPASETEALTQENDAVLGASEASLVLRIRRGNSDYRATRGSRNVNNCHLVESGKFFQRREINDIVWEHGAPDVKSSLEVAAWPDRLVLLLRIEPVQTIREGAIELELQADSALHATAVPPEATLTKDSRQNRWTARLPVDDWSVGEERTLSLVLSTEPEPDSGNIEVSAHQIAPAETPLPVSYDRIYGWHRVGLRNDGNTRDYSEAGNDRIERVALTLKNGSTSARTVRLNFAKGLPETGRVFGITGLSAVLRDRDGYPLGIPVQISKNWHTKKLGRYLGPWYRGFSMVTVPPLTTIELEYTSVNALWGGVPAASHAQLCLVGWGSNQLWDQAAVGSWGESLCFEPDQGQQGGAVLDTRPLMVHGMGNQPKRKWGWTCNVGGADFLVYYDSTGQKQWNSRMRTMRRRTCPVLTEVTYAGKSHDAKIDLQYTVSLYRTDDVSRGVYHFRYDVRKPVSFSRLVFFQSGGDDYSYTGERKFARGNEHGCIEQWSTQWGGDRYRTEPVEVTGRVPWFSMHQAVSRAEGLEAWANRGIVIRQWDARLGGRPAGPWVAERGAKVRGRDTSLFDLLPPPRLQQLQPGDYVEAVVEHVVMPQFADDYYGPNHNLRSALKRDQDTWKMIFREAVGNDLQIAVTSGSLVRRRPTLILAQDNRAAFAMAGGLGYVPITISGLSDYRKPRLEIEEKAGWRTVDQSVHGNDFWQTDYNPETKSWEITYSVPMDTPEDKIQKRQFRFSLAP